MPLVAQCLDELGLGRQRPVLDELEDRRLALAAVHEASTLSIVRSACADLVGGDDERRRQAQHVRAGREDEEPLLAAGIDDRPDGTVELGAEQQPATPHRADAGERLEPRGELGAALAHRGQQLLVDRLDDGGRGCCRNRIAAEGGAVVAGHEAGRSPVAGEQGSNGQPISQALGERDQVRPDPELLEGEERARAAHPGLYLVDAEQGPDLERELGRRLREGGLERDHAALAEHGLEEEERRVARGRERGLEGFDVIRAGERDAGHERAEAFPLGRLAGGGERPERPSVEAALERHDPGSARRLARDLQRRLVRLGARVAEERLPALEPLREEGREAEHRLRPVQVRGMPEPVELLVGGGERSRRAMPEPDDRDPRHEVEVLTPRVVPDAAALPADDGDVGPRVRRQHGLARR